MPAKAVIIAFATVLRVIDGDTVVVDLMDCNVEFACKKLPVRMAHLDTPELHGKCPKEIALAEQAKARAESLLKPGQTITLANPKRDNYYRGLVALHPLQEQLIAAGLAYPYEGEKKSKDWCL